MSKKMCSFRLHDDTIAVLRDVAVAHRIKQADIVERGTSKELVEIMSACRSKISQFCP
jgi:hypothetical protein